MNKEAFGILVTESAPGLYRISKSILKNDADCEDAAQEAIAIAFSKLHTLKNQAYAKTWLMRILINECYRILKKKQKYHLIGDTADTGAHYQPHSYSDLYAAISALETRQRVIIVLYYIEGFSVAETAKILKIPAGTVKSRLSRARARLKEQLTESEDFRYEKI